MIVEDIMFRLIGDNTSLSSAVSVAMHKMEALKLASAQMAVNFSLRQDRTAAIAGVIQNALNSFKASQVAQPVTGVSAWFGTGAQGVSRNALMIQNAMQAVQASMNAVKVPGIAAWFGPGAQGASNNALMIRNALAAVREEWIKTAPTLNLRPGQVRPFTGADAIGISTLRIDQAHAARTAAAGMNAFLSSSSREFIPSNTEARLVGIGNSLRGLGDAASQTVQSFNNMALRMGVNLDPANFVRQSFALAGAFETARVQFGVMMGGVEKGRDTFESLVGLAAETPLTLLDVTQAARTVVQYDAAGQDLTATLRMLGDVTGGDTERFQRMALAFGQVHAAGRLMGQEVLQMVNAGFNPLSEISRTTGRSMDELRQQMREGKITVDMVRAAFASATGPGGRFNNLMAAISTTSQGLWARIVDSVMIAQAAIGDFFIQTLNLKDLMKSLNSTLGGVGQALRNMDPQTKMFVSALSKIVIGLGGIRLGIAAIVAGGGFMLRPFLSLAAAIGPIPALLGAAAVGVSALMLTLRSTFDDINDELPQTVDEASRRMIEAMQLRAVGVQLGQQFSSGFVGAFDRGMGLLTAGFFPNMISNAFQTGNQDLQTQIMRMMHHMKTLASARDREETLRRKAANREADGVGKKRLNKIGELEKEKKLRQDIVEEVQELNSALRGTSDAQQMIFAHVQQLRARPDALTEAADVLSKTGLGTALFGTGPGLAKLPPFEFKQPSGAGGMAAAGAQAVAVVPEGSIGSTNSSSPWWMRLFGGASSAGLQLSGANQNQLPERSFWDALLRAIENIDRIVVDQSN